MVKAGSRFFRFASRRRALVVALTAIYGMAPQLVQANPGGAAVVHGQATLQTQGDKLTVTNTPGAIINWQQFSIKAGETTFFQQQNAASTVLNRVQGQNPALKSQIDGTLGSNGKVFLINPNGVVFGPGSVIDTQGFVASTLSLNDDDFKSGKYKFARDGMAGDIQVQGRISSGNGDVYLIAPNVGVDGNAVITSQGGNVVLAAGEMVEITGRNLNDITFEVQNRGNEVVNLGKLEGGAVGVFAGTLRHSGVVQAQTLAREGGRLVLRAQGDVHLAAGSLSLADGNTVGGSAAVQSDVGNVIVDTGARVSAQATSPSRSDQAATAGGSIAITAQSGYVAVEAGSQVRADGGRGGAIQVKAAKIVQDGAISADGDSSLGGTVRIEADSRVIQSVTATVSAIGVLRGGDIVVQADTAVDGSGHVFSSATLDASASTGVGGAVTVTGRDVSLAATQVHADGDAGGGVIRIGGGSKGSDSTVANATNLTVSKASRVQADARVDGDGGSIMTWADASNRFAGEMTARGGANGGKGGALEVSAGQEVQYGGTVADAGAAMGQGGVFTLDPKFIRIRQAEIIPGVSVELLDPNPGNGDVFGQNMLVANGNVLVYNPTDGFAGTNSGAVYLYDGTSGALLSHLRGSLPNDQVGSGQSIRTLTGGNLLISSPLWNGSAGALTPFDMATGVSGAVSSSTNSLVGAAPGDRIGSGFVTSLGGSKFAIFSPEFNGARGAITWADNAAGITGIVSADNSLVGAFANDRVGNSRFDLMQFNGTSFAMPTYNWNGGAGAVTWIDGNAPRVGAVGDGNSLVGASSGDAIASNGIRDLFNGKALVFSPNWNGAMGAVTWFDTTTGTKGVVGSGNSLVGSTGGLAGDRVGSRSYTQVGSNVAILSPEWNNGSNPQSGAITWVNSGSIGTGPVSVGNSLVGSTTGDRVGDHGFTNLDGVHYAIANPVWNGSMGAVTWIDSTSPATGVIGGGNSLVGSIGGPTGDRVGSDGVQSLYSGKAIVISPDWNSNRGAVTWFDVGTGITGAVSSSNSLVGSTAGDSVGSDYFDFAGTKVAIFSPNWSSDGMVANAGAITWMDVATGLTGVVSAANSLVGSTGGSSGDRVGNNGLEYLDGTHFAVLTSNWNSNRGAVTWVDSTNPVLGAIGLSNSVVGATSGDSVGSDYFDFAGTKVAIFSPNWSSDGMVANAGAITWMDVATGLTGVVSAANSLVGSTGGSSGDRVGNNGLEYLDGTHFAVLTSNWNSNRGAVTWVDSSNPVLGVIGLSNSVVGATGGTVLTGDRIGSFGVDRINSTKALVFSPNWNGNMGAVTWFDIALGSFGVVDASNSLVGSTAGTAVAGDRVGANGYQNVGGWIGLRTPNWNIVNGGTLAGAFTLADATNGVLGVLSASNSLVGVSVNDRVGNAFAQSLGGNIYMLRSTEWNSRAGAITFIDTSAATIPTGLIDGNNSLVGAFAGDQIGSGGVQNLFNGKSLVLSPLWNGRRGAVTWAAHSAATKGVVGASNSLVGSTANDSVGLAGFDTIGNLMAVFSPDWDNGLIANVGAITWADRLNGITGAVTSGNSLVGVLDSDRVGSSGSVYYVAGNLYAVRTNSWGGSAGAVTWIDTSAPLTGAVTPSNSLVGSLAGDQVGSGGFSGASGGSYAVLRSTSWNGNRGAATWIDPNAPRTGLVSSSNSLVGANPNDYVGIGGISFLSNGDYYVRSTSFNANAGAVSIGSALGGISGVVSGANSLVGQNPGDGYAVNDTLSGNRLLVRGINADSGGFIDNGRVHIYAGGAGGGGGAAGALGGQAFSDNSTTSVTISPAQIIAITNTGTAVSLQASTDITLDAESDIVTNNPSGDGGSLTLQAGRSVNLYSNILTDNGNLLIVANELTSNGVLTAQRDPGLAEIVMANGTRLDAGTGMVTLRLRDGSDRTGSQALAGAIRMRSIFAGSLVTKTDTGGVVIGNLAATAPSEIVVLGNADIIAKTSVSLLGGNPGAQALLSANGQITIESPNTELDPAPVLTLTNGGSSARIVNPTASFPLILSGSECIGCTVVSDYEISGGSITVLDTAIGAFLSSIRTRFGHGRESDLSSLNDEDDIAVDSGEICQ